MSVTAKPKLDAFTTPYQTSKGPKNSRTPLRNCTDEMSRRRMEVTHPAPTPTIIAAATMTGNISVPASTRGTTR